MPPEAAHSVAVIGGGPAGLMAAEVLVQGGARVTVYERMPSPGRKLLLAGRGGLNLTHSETLEHLLARYGQAAPQLKRAIEAFTPVQLRAWCEALGQPTFVGSTGRVFPEAMKASPLLRAWLRRLTAQGVSFQLRHCWRGWRNDGRLLFATPQGEVAVAADATILALGGASWPRLGADGAWVEVLARAGVASSPLRPANCGVLVPWSTPFIARFEGAPLKRIALAFADRHVRGEALVTRTGLEGGGIYALSACLRDAIEASEETILRVDLLPGRSLADLERSLSIPRGKQSLANFLRKVTRLAPVAIALLREAYARPGLNELAPGVLARMIKDVPIRLVGVAPLARAISTAGGVRFDELDEHLMIRRRPATFVAGEMLDWEAPTGGYLLQACFATGAAAGRGALRWLGRSPE